MAEWREQAIILRIGHFREADLWVRALMRERGIQTLFAFGGAKSRRRFSGCLDQFNTLDCHIRSARLGEYASLAEAALLASPLRLRADWRRMGIAANCLRFIEACGIGPENAGEGFSLLENLRERLESEKAIPAPLPLFFRLRLAEMLGYGPDFGACAACGRSFTDFGWFLPGEGQTFCPTCAISMPRWRSVPPLRLSAACLDLLDSVRQSQPCEWSDEGIGDTDLRQARRAIDSLVQFHLGLEWNSGTFRRI